MAAEVILVIEDDTHIGGLVVQVLREAGFAPALVRDVRAARDWGSQGNKPAAVISDLMWDAAAAGDWNKARQIHYRLLPLGEGLFVEANPIPAKWLLAQMGLIGPGIRLPLTPLAAEHHAALLAAARAAGILE